MDITIIAVSPFAQNCSILKDPSTGDAVVVDPGDDLDEIEAAAESRGAKLIAIVATHGHVDHVGRAGELRKKLKIPIWGPQREDAFWIEQLSLQGKMFGLGNFNAFEPDRWLEDGDEIRFGNISLEVRHCPGHTPGDVVLIHHPSKIVISNDVLFQGSIGRTDFPRGDYDTLIRSIREKLLTLPDDYKVFPGHGPSTTIGEERETNPFLTGP
ncbi:MAG: MBL fold metallo-hydrolase [Planctomycetes bacterium]|nr:MBL fold metallo-hydrolase [Planctomycetota bacterium]